MKTGRKTVLNLACIKRQLYRNLRDNVKVNICGVNELFTCLFVEYYCVALVRVNGLK